MADRSAKHKGTPTRKMRKERGAPRPPERSAPPPPTPQAVTQALIEPKIGDPIARLHLEKGISELQGLHEILLSGDLDPRVLADFRDALNRVRTAAWAAHQYVVRKETDQDSSSVLSFLVGERIRVTHHLCQGLSDDLKRTDIKFQAGSLVQLHEVTKALTEQLNDIINKLG